MSDVPATIYALCEPDGRPRYVGRTLRPLKRRLYAHLRAARTAPIYPVQWWLAKRMRQGIAVQPRVLELVPRDGDWASRERYWIQRLLGEGERLLNLTLGGEALPAKRSGPTLRMVAGYERMRDRVRVQCQTCRTVFPRARARADKPRAIFCSLKCKSLSQKVSRAFPPQFLAGAETARARRVARTHCKRGHPFSGDNVVFLRGKRRCRACKLSRQRAHYARQKAKGAPANA